MHARKISLQKLFLLEYCSETSINFPVQKKKNESTYAKTMTIKSSQFQGSRRKVNSPTQKPLARIFMSDSKVYIPVKVYLKKIIGWNVRCEMNNIPLKSLQFFKASPRCCWCVDHPTSQNMLHKGFLGTLKMSLWEILTEDTGF